GGADGSRARRHAVPGGGYGHPWHSDRVARDHHVPAQSDVGAGFRHLITRRGKIPLRTSTRGKTVPYMSLGAGDVRAAVLLFVFGMLLGACAESPQHSLHTLRPSVPWPDAKPVEEAPAVAEAPQRIDATPITSYSPPTDVQIQAI